MALSSEVRNLYVDSRAWLVREHVFRSSQYKAGAGRPAYATVRTRSIMEISLPRMWKNFQDLKEQHDLKDSRPSLRLKLKVGQAALHSCAFAQSAYIWNSLAQRHNIKAAGRDSFEELDLYFDNIKFGRKLLPTREMLALPLAKAIEDENHSIDAYNRPASVLRTVAGMALIGLQELSPPGKDTALPAPGYAFGQVVPWVPPRLQSSDFSPNHTQSL